MLDKDIEKILWRDAIIVFDTCALGDVYSLTIDTQQVFVDILTLLKERIWIPAWVLKEFERHHEKFLYNPISNHYGKLERIILKGEQYKKDLSEAISIVADDMFHPYMNKEVCNEITAIYKSICEEIGKLAEKIKVQKNVRCEEIRSVAKSDKLYELLKEIRHGKEFSLKELIQIAQEGKVRYECLIPPGYKDEKEKEKEKKKTNDGIRKYGDLIIWKEILRYAKENDKSIIFISDDIKEDWVVKEMGENEGDPRSELLREFAEEVGRIFWKYTLAQMIEKMKVYFSGSEITLPLYSKLDDVRHQLQVLADFKKAQEKSENLMLLKCQFCGCEFDVSESELCLEWQPNGSYERSMGEEREYIAEESVSCPHCRRIIDITLHVWEYPIGAYNIQTIEAKGGKVLKEMDLFDVVDFNDENYEICEICGEYKYIAPEKYGMCYDCYEKKWNEITTED